MMDDPTPLPGTEIPDHLAALADDVELLKKIERDAPIYLFKPNRPQRDLISSDATYRCLFGANKVGKSTIGIIEDTSLAIGCRPYLPEDHPRYKTPFKPPVRGMVFAETWDKVEDIHVNMFDKWIPKGWAEKVKKQGYVRGYRFVKGPGAGSEIKFSTYETDAAKLEGSDYNFYHFDEPPPPAHWAPVTRGIVVKKGMIHLTLTLVAQGWIWDEVWERAEAGDSDYFAVVGRMEENTILDEKAIDRFSKTLDESQREVRLFGKPQHLQGRVFKHFEVKEPWVIPPWDIPRDWPTVRAFDPHIAKPVAGLWAKVSPTGQLIITDETYDNSIQTMDEFRSKVQQIEAGRHDHVAMSLMDSAGAAPGGLGGSSYFDLFKKYGIPCQPAPKANKHARLMETAERFKLDSFTGLPRIQIFSTCKRLVWEIKRYVHPTLKQGSRTDKWKEMPEGSAKKDDDLIDDLLYLVSRDPRYEFLQPEATLFSTWESQNTPMMAEEYRDAFSSGTY